MKGIGSRMRLPLAGCDRNIASSSGVSLPGLFSLSLRTPILPTSCMRPTFTTVSISGPLILRPIAMMRAYIATRSEWPRV